MVRGVYVWPDARDLRLCGMVMGVRSGASGGVADSRTRWSRTRRPSGVAKGLVLRLGSSVGACFEKCDAIRLISRIPPQLQIHVYKDDASRRTKRRAIPVTHGGVTPIVTCRRKRMTMHMFSPAVMRVMTPRVEHTAPQQQRRLYSGCRDGVRQCVPRGLVPRLDTCRPIPVTIRPNTHLTTGAGTRMSVTLTSCDPAGMATGKHTVWNMRVTGTVQIRCHIPSSGRRTSGIARQAGMPMRSDL